VKLSDYRGRVVAVTFIFTLCADTCPVLTPMMSFVQDRLGEDFGERIAFVSITVDPERDTPEVLKEYAQAFGANLAGWSFLTGAPDAIREVTRRYGVFAAKNANGGVDHTFFLPRLSTSAASCACNTSACASIRRNFAAIS